MVIVLMGMKNSGGFDGNGKDMTSNSFQPEPAPCSLALHDALRGNRKAGSFSSWNGRAVFVGSDPERLRAKVDQAVKMMRTSTGTFLQELHSNDQLMTASFRMCCRTHFIWDSAGLPCWSNGEQADSHEVLPPFSERTTLRLELNARLKN